ncbi:MAG: class I SAM-dependent methyltransferase, partial [Aureliella sp.]
MTVDDSWVWLAREGHEMLGRARVLSHAPLRIEWPDVRLAEWQRAMLEEQVRFRIRSRDRFTDPESWLWTDRSLQQASDGLSASYKASLFAPELPVIDACCGAGADLVAFAQQHRVCGIDRDRRLALLARANLRAHRLEGDVCVAELPASIGDISHAALHIDPDRRSGEERSTRTIHGEAFSPSLAESMALGERARAAVIKLAPATEFEAETLGGQWRRSWLGSTRGCPQQLLLRGQTQLQIAQGQVAAILCRHAAPAEVYCGVASTSCSFVEEPEEYIYEPHPPLYAAHLAATWASEHDASALSSARGYFTGDRPLASSWAQTF